MAKFNQTLKLWYRLTNIEFDKRRVYRTSSLTKVVFETKDWMFELKD